MDESRGPSEDHIDRMSPLCVEATDTAAACIAATQGAMSSAATAHIGLPSLTSTLTSTVVDDRWTSRVSSAKVHHQLVGYRILASRTIVMDHAAQPRPKNRHRSDLRGTGGPWVSTQELAPEAEPRAPPQPAANKLVALRACLLCVKNRRTFRSRCQPGFGYRA